MRFAVEAWAVEYGSAMDDAADLAVPTSPPDVSVEVPAERWAPQTPGAVPAVSRVLFSDGVRRVDARVWIDDGDQGTRLGLCASFGAGLVEAIVGDGAGRARVVAAEVRRGLFTGASRAETIVTRDATFPLRACAGETPEALSLALQQRMGELELCLAGRAETNDAADLVVVDGPLRGAQTVPNAIGYIKTHRVAYLPAVVSGVVAALGPGQRTPLFLTTTSWSRYAWYLRLPGGSGHPWAGVVRCEASADLDIAEAVTLADRSAATVGRFASRPHKDARAPQNLYPIAGLERALRHRLGDPGLLYRSLCLSAA